MDGCVLHLPHLQTHQCSKFGKVVFCEMTLCPGMQWVKVSSKQRDLCFVPLAGTHYMASECCFSCGFPSRSWIQAESWNTKEGESKQVPKGRVKAQRMQGHTHAIALYLPRLWRSSIPRRGWDMLLFPSKFRKIQPQAFRLEIPFFVCLFNCIKKPFCDVLAVA